MKFYDLYIRSTISLLMDVMAAHKQSNILLNCLQCLCNFNIPAEVVMLSNYLPISI